MPQVPVLSDPPGHITTTLPRRVRAALLATYAANHIAVACDPFKALQSFLEFKSGEPPDEDLGTWVTDTLAEIALSQNR